MKSIMQEASSVIKAIEKGWETAGKPKEFSIKVFEEPKRNFIGMTIQTAKVGIFFDEKSTTKVEPGITKQRQEIRKPVQKNLPAEQRKEVVKPGVHKRAEDHGRGTEARVIKTEQQKNISEQRKDHQTKILWTSDMISAVQEWLNHVLQELDMGFAQYKIEPALYHLKIQFNKPLLADHEKERQLFRSFSVLIMQTIRRKLKRPLRGFKIILTHVS